MRNKVTDKIISLVLVFASVFVLFAQSVPKAEAGAVAIADFKSKIENRWVWKNCKSIEDLNSTSIFNERVDVFHSGNQIIDSLYSNIKDNDFLYAFVLVSGNTDKSYYFPYLPGDVEYHWNSGSAKNSLFDPTTDEFASVNQLSWSYLLFDGKRLDGDSASFRFVSADDGVLTYNGSYKKDLSKGKLYGLKNDSFTNFYSEFNAYGEGFVFQFDSSRANGNTGNVRVIEADNTSYHWASYNDDQSYGETKKSRGDDEYFYLWIGRYLSCDGLDAGDYTIKSDSVVCSDSDYAVIKQKANLTIEQGATLTVKGKLYLDGTIYNYGTIIIEDGGELIIGGTADSFGQLDNENCAKGLAGHFVIQNGGTLTITPRTKIDKTDMIITKMYYTLFCANGANFINNGTVKMNGSSNIYFTNCDFENCSEGVIKIPYSSSTTFDVFKKSFIKSDKLHTFVNNGAVYSGSRKLN